MFRIRFVVDGAYWAIQFLRWECFWESVKGGVKDPNDTTGKVTKQVLKFDTYNDAYKYAEQRGITEVYQQKEASPPSMFDSGNYAPPPPMRVASSRG